MIIATSIESMLSHNNLRVRGRTASTAMRRLASGLRINYAADDPSGLAIATGMRARIGGLNTAVQNMQDGINMLRTTEGSMRETSDIMKRIRDLAVRGEEAGGLGVGDIGYVSLGRPARGRLTARTQTDGHGQKDHDRGNCQDHQSVGPSM